jgi:hypothetical protein
LSRRLGDDPLNRARSKRIKSVEGSASVAPDAEGERAETQVGIQTASRASYNDVFFQRRGEGFAPQQVAAAVLVAPEVPEISEISEIPEIREAAAASGNQAAFDVTADIKTASEAAQETQRVPAPAIPKIEETASNLSAESSGTASTAGPPTEVKGEPASLPASSPAPANGGDQPKPETQKSGGFFKRLFGKFK